MRKSLALAVLLGATILAGAQPPAPPPTRYSVLASTDAYSQKSPKDALNAVLRAVEKGRIDYIAAHLLDPSFIDAKVADRAALIELDVEKELLEERDAQRVTPPRNKEPIPQAPVEFREFVRHTARERAFRLLVREIRDTLAENPDHLKDFRKILRAGTFVDAGEASSASHKDLKDRQIFFRRLDGRWFVEDRQKAEPAPKK